MIRRPIESNFYVNVSEVAVDVIFAPTQSQLTYSRLIEVDHGVLSPRRGGASPPGRHSCSIIDKNGAWGRADGGTARLERRRRPKPGLTQSATRSRSARSYRLPDLRDLLNRQISGLLAQCMCPTPYEFCDVAAIRAHALRNDPYGGTRRAMREIG